MKSLGLENKTPNVSESVTNTAFNTRIGESKGFSNEKISFLLQQITGFLQKWSGFIIQK